MCAYGVPVLDLMPPAFAEGLYDWSRGDGTPDSPTYGDPDCDCVRIIEDDPDLGSCLELRKNEATQRLRYMGEMPLRPASFIEVSARIKGMGGPRALVRVSAWPGGRMGRPVPGLETCGRVVGLDIHGRVYEACAVIGTEALPGIDMVWNDRVLYAHVGLDLIGPSGGVVRIADIRVRDVTAEVTGQPRVMPGFTTADLRVVGGRH